MLATSLPKGFKIPDGAKEGTEFDTVATFIVNGDQISLKAIEGLPVGADSEEDTETPEEAATEDEVVEEAADDGGDFMGSIERGLGGSAE